MKYILVVGLLLVFNACSVKKVEPQSEIENQDINITQALKNEEIEKTIPIYDLVRIPQRIDTFSKKIDSETKLLDIQKKYEKYYFSMWDIQRPTEPLSEVKWPFNSYQANSSYGENLQPLEQSFFDEMLQESNFDKYATLNKQALTLKHLNIRAFPTLKPLFADPKIAGEGFPFDYLQNISLAANKPIFVSHYSLSKRWVYIFSSFASGWVESDSIVFMKKEHTDLWKKSIQVHITKENVPIYSTEGKYLFHSRIGMSFALIGEDRDSYTVLSVGAYKSSQPLFLKSKISKDISTKSTLKLNAKNLEMIINEVFYTHYGWGGMYEQRDCSSTLRDIYAPFGIWLPRNSSQQSKIGKKISLEGLNKSEKISLIKKEAIPFQTFLYKQGHIVLYVGTYNGEVVVLHNTWGIKTLKESVEGRVVIGKTVLSSLKLGKKQPYYDEESEILKNLNSINIFTK